MIDPLSDDLLTLSQAARQLPSLRAGRPVSVSTLVRWSKRGVRGVRLKLLRIGSRTFVEKASLRQFCEELTRTSGLHGGITSSKDNIDIQKEERIEAELKARFKI